MLNTRSTDLGQISFYFNLSKSYVLWENIFPSIQNEDKIGYVLDTALSINTFTVTMNVCCSLLSLTVKKYTIVTKAPRNVMSNCDYMYSYACICI